MSIEDLRAIAQRVRANAEAAGKLAPPHRSGSRDGTSPNRHGWRLLEDLASGLYDRAAQAVADGDPEMAQG
jgi:hypothetical protein